MNIIDEIDRTAAFGVFGTPFIAINGVLAFVGVPREGELRGKIVQALD